MATNDVVSKYFSGQGIVMIADKDPVTGAAKGFTPVGNVSDLKISISTSVIEHKESSTGQRGIDKRLTTESKAALSMTLESFSKENLALALRGDNTSLPGATVTSEAHKLYFGKVEALAYAKLSVVTSVSRGATALTPYTNDATPYDYKVNLDAGSFTMNDGQKGILLDKATLLGTACSGSFIVISGSKATFHFASAPATAAVGGRLAVQGAAGTNASVVNGKSLPITAVTGTTVEVELGLTGQTITGSGTTLCVADGDALTVTYNYGAQDVTNVLTTGSVDKVLRFEGLNTADGNKPCIVEIFKFQADPLKELALISDALGAIQLDGNVLYDALQAGAGKYFKMTLL